VLGYPDSAAVGIAMERGELDGYCSFTWAAVKSARPNWIEQKQINVLLQLSLTKHPELPDVPSLPEAGLKARIPSSWWGIFAPKGTPAAIVQRLESELARIVADGDTRERMNRISVVPFYLSSAEMRKMMKEDSDINAELIRSTGMRLE